jgi:hypothetical protein
MFRICSFKPAFPFPKSGILSILSKLSILSLPHFEDICVEDDGMGLGAWGMEKE